MVNNHGTATDGDGGKPKRLPNGKFAPGQCGNPRGRPRGARGLLTIFNEKRDEKIDLKVDGKLVRMSRKEAWITNMWNKAIACDPKASANILQIMRASGQFDPDPAGDAQIGPDDATVLEALIGRMASRKDSSDE